MHPFEKTRLKRERITRKRNKPNPVVPVGHAFGLRSYWPVAITTAPRTEVTYDATLASIRNAGFNEPVTFDDSDSIGGWSNFLRALRGLIDRNPEAPAYVVSQDDVLYSANAAEYVEKTAPMGLINLGLSDRYINSPEGWSRSPDKMMGALCLIFPRDLAYRILADEVIQRYNKRTGIDEQIGIWTAKHNIPVWIHNPSLVGHIGRTSAMYPGLAENRKRRLSSWLGEEWDCLRWVEKDEELRTVAKVVGRLPRGEVERLPMPRYNDN